LYSLTQQKEKESIAVCPSLYGFGWGGIIKQEDKYRETILGFKYNRRNPCFFVEIDFQLKYELAVFQPICYDRLWFRHWYFGVFCVFLPRSWVKNAKTPFFAWRAIARSRFGEPTCIEKFFGRRKWGD
jgi:hypothetical protein